MGYSTEVIYSGSNQESKSQDEKTFILLSLIWFIYQTMKTILLSSVQVVSTTMRQGGPCIAGNFSGYFCNTTYRHLRYNVKTDTLFSLRFR